MIPMLAWRNIWRNKMRSLVIIFSIALGLFAGLAILSLYEGMMKSRIRTVIDEELGHIQLHHPSFSDNFEPACFIAGADTVITQINKLPFVQAICVRSVAQGMLSTPTGSAGVQINGIVPEQEYSFSLLKQKLIEGNGFPPSKSNRIIIGKKLADKMTLKTGSKIVLTFTDTANNMVSAAFRIAAVYRSRNTPLDEKNVYILQSEMNALLGMQHAVYEIAVKITRDADLPLATESIQTKFPGLKTQSWKALSPETDFMAKTVDDYSYIIMTIIMLALAFGITNTMLMAIMERTREIGMMVALGTGKKRIFLMVLLETLYLTLVGAPFGILMVRIVIACYARSGLNLAGMGEDLMGNFGFSTMVYPEFPAAKLPAICAIVAATALVASILPALKALHMKPVDALRN